MAAAVTNLPVNPALRELWEARPQEEPRTRRVRRSIGAVFIVVGMFLWGIGAGGLCALLTTAP